MTVVYRRQRQHQNPLLFDIKTSVLTITMFAYDCDYLNYINLSPAYVVYSYNDIDISIIMVNGIWAFIAKKEQ